MLRRTSIPLWALVACFASPVTTPTRATVPPDNPTRFDRLVRHDPAAAITTIAATPESLPDFEAGRRAWQDFRAAYGEDWRVFLDGRTRTPLLVEGSGIPWSSAGEAAAVRLADLERAARDFVTRHVAAFLISPEELVLSGEGSGSLDRDHRVLVFQREVEGIAVEGQRLVLYVTRGRLVAFGAGRWGSVPPLPAKRLDAETARDLLSSNMRLTPRDRVETVKPPALVWVAAPSGEGGRGARLVWQFTLRVAGTRGTWVGKVDAVDGGIVALYDDDRYDGVQGGVHPESSDGICPSGCEQPGTPMPFADVDIDGAAHTAGSMGLYECPAGGVSAATTLSGPYVRIQDTCGAISESASCGTDLDLSESGGLDCAVPPGASPGNTHSSRDNFYHLNRVKEKVRAWLPYNQWIDEPLTSNVNVDTWPDGSPASCNGFWDGQTVNLLVSDSQCRNFGEISGVIHHEFGHGLDFNDGGGYDEPAEGYADVVELFQNRASCLARGAFWSGTCGGYGDTCLTCTGTREIDWDQRAAHTPATPQGFVKNNCGSGGTRTPCGGASVHCEGMLLGETVYDLAVRDLPAAGLDQASAWQLAEKLFYGSRQGSGGDAYNCDLSMDLSDGCNVDSWYTKFRVVDDDDGDLANGTPHAAAIFAAFDRHNIACGLASDPQNQDSGTCPALAAPTPSATAGHTSVQLSWPAVVGADSYLVLRNDQSCTYSDVIIARLPATLTRYTDLDPPNDRPVFYRVQAQGATVGCDSPLSACQTVTPQAGGGSIKLLRPGYGCSHSIGIEVRDGNAGTSTVTATILSDSETSPETVTLSESVPGSGRYSGSIDTTTGPPTNGDGLLALQDGDSLTARYTDADDGLGGVNLLREADAVADCVPPVISSVESRDVDDGRATIVWVTTEPATSVVHWGEIEPPDRTLARRPLLTDHQVKLSGLQECTKHVYSVESEDFGGNVVVDDNGGQFHRFETLGDFGGGLQDCHRGVVLLEPDTVACTDTLNVRLVDMDLNLDPLVVETAIVDVTSSTETTPLVLTLTESGPNTSQFTGSVAAEPGAPTAGDGILQVGPGDVLTATYRDTDDGTGTPATTFVTGSVDCAGPRISDLRVTSLTDDSAVIEWTVSEPASGRVDWGPTAALGNTESDATLATAHAFTIGPLTSCARYHFRVTSTDAVGNTTVADAEGSPFGMNAYEIPGLLHEDGFETDAGWTREGEWEIGEPLGLGGAIFYPDPTSAFEGLQVLGHDLSGQGANPGDYEPSRNERAISPVIDASTLTNGELVFRRHLNADFGATASIEIFQGGQFRTVWSEQAGVFDFDWNQQSVDISAFADGNPTMRVAFRLSSPPFVNPNSSWNVDELIIKDGSLPLYDACGGCAGAPTFSGASAAVDDDPCADSGVTVSWQDAPAWGTGATGTFSVYRDTAPGFTPSSSNRVATGVGGTSWTDLAAPDGVDLYYVVRAENDESCGGGPNNGGLTDSNTVYVSARDDVSQPAPGDLGGSLRVDPVNAAHVRLSWAATSGAARYHVYRSDDPQGPFAQIGEVSGLFYEDLGELASGTDRYYESRAADACGNEGP